MTIPFDEQGCRFCRAKWLGFAATEPEKLASDPAYPVFVYRCRRCGTYWLETESRAYAVEEDRAKEFLR